MSIRGRTLKSLAFILFFVFLAITREDLTQAQAALTLRVDKSQAGRVDGGGISCGTTCQVQVQAGTQVTLSATPEANYFVKRWYGCDSASDNQCTATINANTTITVTFDSNTRNKKWLTNYFTKPLPDTQRNREIFSQINGTDFLNNLTYIRNKETTCSNYWPGAYSRIYGSQLAQGAFLYFSPMSSWYNNSALLNELKQEFEVYSRPLKNPSLQPITAAF